MQFLKLFLVAFVVFMVIDLLWLGLIARKLYKKHLGYIMAEKVQWVAAIVFYVIFIIGLTFFALYGTTSLLDAFLKGAFFGFLAYATYDLTNLATLKGWPLKITIIDLIWGTSLGALVSTITYLLVVGV